MTADEAPTAKDGTEYERPLTDFVTAGQGVGAADEFVPSTMAPVEEDDLKSLTRPGTEPGAAG